MSYARSPSTRRSLLHDVEWLIAPGERTGILGVNGAGKSTLLGLIAGSRRSRPSAGSSAARPCSIAILDQRLVELDEFARRRVSDVVAEQQNVVASGAAAELTPGQLLERLGFTSAQLSTPVKDLWAARSAGCSCC